MSKHPELEPLIEAHRPQMNGRPHPDVAPAAEDPQKEAPTPEPEQQPEPVADAPAAPDPDPLLVRLRGSFQGPHDRTAWREGPRVGRDVAKRTSRLSRRYGFWFVTVIVASVAFPYFILQALARSWEGIAVTACLAICGVLLLNFLPPVGWWFLTAGGCTCILLTTVAIIEGYRRGFIDVD